MFGGYEVFVLLLFSCKIRLFFVWDDFHTENEFCRMKVLSCLMKNLINHPNHSQPRYHHFQHKGGRARVHFHEFSAIFPFEFYQFLPVFDFLMLTDQEQVLKTPLSLDALTKGNHMELGRALSWPWESSTPHDAISDLMQCCPNSSDWCINARDYFSFQIRVGQECSIELSFFVFFKRWFGIFCPLDWGTVVFLFPGYHGLQVYLHLSSFWYSSPIEVYEA